MVFTITKLSHLFRPYHHQKQIFYMDAEFRQPAHLISVKYGIPLFILRRNRCQRPHVPEYHILLLLRYLKIPDGILHSYSRMGKAMEMFPCLFCMGVPVIKEQIMEQAGPRRGPAVPASVSAYLKGDVGDLNAVRLAGRRPVLDKLIHGLKDPVI